MERDRHVSSKVDRYEKDYQTVSKYLNRFTSATKTSALELAFIVSFIFNLILGKFLHIFSPKEEVYNYFNDKGNFLNQIFVKKGWAWTTIIIVAFYALILLKKVEGHNTGGATNKYKIISRAVINYILVTVWWIFFTQWFFGLPIMDRVFVFTGGKCTNVSEELYLKHKLSPHLFEKLVTLVDENGASLAAATAATFESSAIPSYLCRKVKGSWEGGHDPSGHVFLLIHSSLYLVFESLPYWQPWSKLRNDMQVLKIEARSLATTWKTKLLKTTKFISGHPHILVISLVGLWWWMLFMTSLYFHSIAEKFVGLLFGYVAFGVLYYLPRWL